MIASCTQRSAASIHNDSNDRMAASNTYPLIKNLHILFVTGLTHMEVHMHMTQIHTYINFVSVGKMQPHYASLNISEIKLQGTRVEKVNNQPY